jgi:putative transposase
MDMSRDGLPGMVRYRRNFIPGGTFFFTVTLANRRSTALVDHIGAVRSAFRAARRARPFSIDAIVILPDHLHAILTLPANDADFSGRWRRIKGHFSGALLEAGVHLKRRPNGDLALWQRRFWEHTIRDENDFARHVDYVHFNPVKHGLASRVRDWPFSSFHRYVRDGLLPDDWAGDARNDGSDFGEPTG